MRQSTTSFVLSAVVLATLLAGAVGAQATYVDLPYGSVNGQVLSLDLYLPPATGEAVPCIVWIHGGGWWAGSKDSAATDAPALNAAGFAVAAVQYRMSTQASWPAQIHDCKGAVRWLRANAAGFGIDPDRIGAFGPSAGGHLAAMLGASEGVAELEGDTGGNLGYSSAVQAVAEFSGEMDLFQMPAENQLYGTRESTLIGMALVDISALVVANDPGADAWADLVNSASPPTWVTGNAPPFYVAHGTNDGVIPPSQSMILVDALVAAGVPVEYRVVPGAGHTLPLDEYPLRTRFLQRVLLASPLPVGAPEIAVSQLVPLGEVATVNLTAGAPGTPCLLFLSLDSGFAAAGDAGWILVDVAAATFLASGIMDAQGAYSAAFPVLDVPELQDQNLYFQAATLPTTTTVLLGSAASMHLMPATQ